MKKEEVWLDGGFIKADKASVPLLTHSLHYGSGVFEGIRAYKTERGTAVFRLKDHVKRLFFSATTIGVKIPYSPKQIEEAILTLVKRNSLEEGYIRPLAFYGQRMGLYPIGAPVHIAIACWPWGKYLAKERVDVKISKFMRLHPASSVMGAKISGHYSNSILASLEAKKAGFDEALLLDHKGNVAEGPGENIFFVKGKTIYTPKKEAILPGLTRDSVITIAKDLGYKVVEKDIKPSEIKSFDEAFFTGTAVEVCPIAKIDNNKFLKSDASSKIREVYMDVVKGKAKKYSKWLTTI